MSQGAHRDPPEPYDPLVEGRAFVGGGFGPLPAEPGDAVAMAEAPNLRGNAVRFFALPDGSLIVDQEEGDAAVEPLARAVERILSPPYVAQSERRSDRIWAVYAFKIDVVRFGAWGDEIEVSRIDSTTTTTVDGRNGEPVPALDQLGERYGASFALTATRLDGDLWAVRGGAL